MSDPLTNSPEYTVSELAFALKKTVEDTYGRVRVRGELGRVTVAKSGHCYLDVKDDKAVINSIIWKGVMGRLPMRPEEGMEVICEGKLSTYPGRSNYQLIIDRMEPAGEGALMALLEKRRKAFAAEGLFDEERKKDLPFMPLTIGVVTSPTGAVIRDILHRIADRFPAHVILWPAVVQGKSSAAEVARGVNGFNALEAGGRVPRPDVLIVARGGGSIEDLWGFNEELAVRAVANSEIPIIAAVGHETDWTLVDYAADYRAPTPTGAAEVAVPVRADFLATTEDYQIRLRRALTRTVESANMAVKAARLPKLSSLLSGPQQRLDLARLPQAESLLLAPRQKLALAAARLPRLTAMTEAARQRLTGLMARMKPALAGAQNQREQRLASSGQRLTPAPLKRRLSDNQAQIARLSTASGRAASQKIDSLSARLDKAGQLLTAYSYHGVLERGYALVSDEAGAIVRSGEALSQGDAVTLTFKQGVKRAAKITDGAPAPQSKVSAKKTPEKGKKKATAKKPDQSQMGLF